MGVVNRGLKRYQGTRVRSPGQQLQTPAASQLAGRAKQRDQEGHLILDSPKRFWKISFCGSVSLTTSLNRHWQQQPCHCHHPYRVTPTWLDPLGVTFWGHLGHKEKVTAAREKADQGAGQRTRTQAQMQLSQPLLCKSLALAEL